MLLVSAGAGEGLFAIFAFEPLGVDGYGGNIPWFPRRWQLPFRAKRRHGRGIGQGATQEADVERRQGTTHFSSRIQIFLLLFLIFLLLERRRRMLAAQWQGLGDRRSIGMPLDGTSRRWRLSQVEGNKLSGRLAHHRRRRRTMVWNKQE